MAYRAHVTAHEGFRGPRVNPDRVLKATTVPNARKGTRNGRPGFWIEATTKAAFVWKVQSTALVLDNIGYAAEIALTNHPSYEAIRTASLPRTASWRRG